MLRLHVSSMTLSIYDKYQILHGQAHVLTLHAGLFFMLLFQTLIITFSKSSFRNPTSVSNWLDPDQDLYSVGPDLGHNCLQRLLISR